MKVLIINRYMGLYGGAETVIKELGCHLNKLGVINRILTLNISPDVRKICGPLDIVTSRENFSYEFRSGSFWSSLGIIREMRALRELAREQAAGFDIVNAHNFPADWVVKDLGPPVVWMCNEVPDFYNNPKLSLSMKLLRSFGISLDRHIVNRDIDVICAADDFNAGKVRQRYGRDPEIIPYGVDYDFFSQEEGRDEAVRKYGLENSFVLLQSGMLSPEKNQLKSIQALEALQEIIPGLKLVLAGRPQSPYDEMLKRYIAEKGLKSDIIFTGHISKQEIRALYHVCDIALFPVKAQGGWLSPFEAICAGKPILTSTTMGAASLIKKGSLGLVSDDFVAGIKDIYGRYDVYASMAKKAAAWVKENLSWDLFARKMLQVFESVYNKQGSVKSRIS